MAVLGRHCKGIPQTQIVEFIEFRRRLPHAVALVHHKDKGLAALLQHSCHLMVICGDTCAYISQEQYYIGAVYCHLCLTAHLSQYHIIGTGLYTAGIDQHKLPAAPLTFGVYAVSCDTGGILHYGEALAHQLVEKRGFAHIGAAHYRYYGK